MDVIGRYWLIALFFTALISLNGCASHKKVDGGEIVGSAPPIAKVKEVDPWEGYNRGVFKFNDKLDTWLLKPVAKGYRFVAPSFVEKGVNNFFANLGEINGVFNNLLQWKWKRLGNNSGRFLINTTVGIGGLFDIAKHTGLQRLDPESFGQTLSYWGLGPGPYFVLPLLGPSTLTDAFATPVDWYVNPFAHADVSDDVYFTLKGLDIVSSRANLLDAEELISGDKYIFIREAYMQRRNHLVKDGEVVDDFGDFDDFGGDF